MNLRPTYARRRLPILSTDFTVPLPPVTAASRFEINLSSSSSTMSGRTMNITSYVRSIFTAPYSFQGSAAKPLCPHGSRSLFRSRSPITFFRFFCSLVEDVHRFRYAFFHDHLHCIGRPLQHLVCDLKLLLLHWRQHIISAVRDRMSWTHSHPYADEIWPHGSHH